MKATVATSKARAEDVEVGDVIRYDLHESRDSRPVWSHWMRVLGVQDKPARKGATGAIELFFTFEGIAAPVKVRKLNIVEVQALVEEKA